MGSDSSSSSSFGFQVRRSPIPSKGKEVEDPVSDSGHESDHSSEAGRIAPKKKERKGAKVSKAFDKCREEAKKKNKRATVSLLTRGGHPPVRNDRPKLGRRRKESHGRRSQRLSLARRRWPPSHPLTRTRGT